MNRLAILGSYPEGPETTSAKEIAGLWSPWKRDDSSPLSVWKTALTAIDKTINRSGFIHVYIYYGKTLPVKQVARVDKVHLSEAMVASPGPTFSFAEGEEAHVWLRYSYTSKLARPIDYKDFLAVPPTVRGDAAPHPLTEQDWSHMYRTGLVFIEDPKAVGGWL